MKMISSLLIGVLLLVSPLTKARASSLYIKNGRSLIDVEQLVKNQVDVQVDYGYKKFCYQGNSSVVVNKMKTWSSTDYFFSGGGGGFRMSGLKINRGVATYDIVMVLEDEVVPGEFKRVLIKPCR
jgi:hypothetical protein